MECHGHSDSLGHGLAVTATLRSSPRYLFAGLSLLTALVGRVRASTNPTFYQDVQPILQDHCQVCHRRGEIGPMPFVSYADTRPWAKAIRTAVLSRKMPPWFADPAVGHFMNDRRLSERDIGKIVSWVDAGAPEGDPKDRHAPVAWTDGWNIKPDAVFQMPEPFTIPATGILDYVYVVIPTRYTRDIWVTAAEVRPGARAAVHHAIAVVRPPGSPWLKEAKPLVPYIPPAEPDSGQAQPAPNDPQSMPVSASYEYLAGYSPGMQPERFDIDHSAKLIPAGSDIVLQIHYTTNGKNAMRDQTRIGITFAREAPQKRFVSAVASGWRWAIPPGNPNYQGAARLTFGEPLELVFLQPHMHLRGKDITVRLVYPGGKTETMLAVPHYDFNWQIVYYLDKPRLLPAGTRVEVTAHWDNSANNPRNPDPTATVHWGNQSTDEMLSVAMGVIVPLD
jgi:mono/diheme cytochrome c family protein